MANSVRTELAGERHFSHRLRVCSSKPLVSLILVVRSTPESQVINRCRAAISERDKVVELQEPALGAPARLADKGALTGIALPHLALDGGRHVTRIPPARTRARIRLQITGPHWMSWAIGLREPLLLEISERERQRAIEDDRRIAVRY